ncbi:MAG: hypothetical protein LBI03_03255, partial [Clostridiales bacterium]|nr:hypothetical protein [Clostridiales bacterium]
EDPPIDEFVTNESLEQKVMFGEPIDPDLAKTEELPLDNVAESKSTESSSDTEEMTEFESPDQDELNELVTDITSMGLDDNVLGRNGLNEAIRDAEDAEAKGGSYLEGFTISIERQMSEKQNDPVEINHPNAESLPPGDRDPAYEKYIDHKNKLEAGRESGIGWHRDSVDAYHRMGMTYNAYVSGEKINGLPVTKADVFISGVRFYQSNIFETAIIRAVKFACNVLGDKHEGKIETEQNAIDKGIKRPGPLKDDLGACDNGDAKAVSAENIKQVRTDIPEYGIEYGIDTTKGLSYNSADNLKIYQPTDYISKIDIGGGKSFNVLGIRMVDVDGNRALVGPDGKVVHESIRNETGLTDGDKARLESRYDAFESKAAKDPISHMAENRGISVEELKSQYTEKAMDTYASRVENQMLGEANRLETRTIPEAREEMNSLRQDFNKLDKLETAISRSGAEPGEIKLSDIQDLKIELSSGIEKLETRINAMENRVELLRDVHAQVNGASIEDRFDRAASTEDNAVGRAGRIEYIDQDTDKKIIDTVDQGTEKITGDIEKYNTANPESSVSYDVESGELYNKFGVSESGKYDEKYATVDKSELPSDNPDSIQEYISKHIDVDFDKYRDYEPEQQDSKQEVEAEQQQGTEVGQQETNPDVEQSQHLEGDTYSTDTPDTSPEGEHKEKPDVETAAEKQLHEENPDAEKETKPETEHSEKDETQDMEHDIDKDSDKSEKDPVDSESDIEAETEQHSFKIEAEATAEETEIKIGVAEGSEQEDFHSSDEINSSKSEKGNDTSEENEAQAVAAHDDEASGDTSSKHDEKREDTPVESESTTQSDEFNSSPDTVDIEIMDQYKEYLDIYFLDTENVIIIEDDVVQPILDVYEGSGQSDFKEIFDAISEIMAGQDDIMTQIDKYIDLVDAFIEAAPDPAEAYDMFSNSLIEAGVPEEISNAVMDEMFSMDRIAETMETGEVQVTIGDQELIVDEIGIFDAATGEPAGGFTDDQTANEFYESAEQSLYDTGYDRFDVDASDNGIEAGSPVDTESLTSDFEEIKPDISVGDDPDFEVGGVPETAVEVPGGLEGVEAAEAGAAVEGVEAAAALLL